MSNKNIATELCVQESSQTQWWYYSGHLTSGSRRFGFHLAFFHRRPNDVRFFGRIPVSLISRLFKFSHFSIADFENAQFFYAQQRSIWNGKRTRGNQLEQELRLRSWYIRINAEKHQVHAESGSHKLSLDLSPEKPLVRHGNGGRIHRVDGQAAHHVSYTRIRAEGCLTIQGKRYDVAGNAWMDSEYGLCDFGPGLVGWDWFSLQLDDNREIMMYLVRGKQGQLDGHQVVTLIDAHGTVETIPASSCKIIPSRFWTSPETKTEYPIAWDLQFPRWNAEFRIAACLPCQELDTDGSTGIVYWEGAVDVTGHFDSRSVLGRGYVELVGYNKSNFKIFKKSLGVSEIARILIGNLNYFGKRHRCVRFQPK
ncbi:MAG TPA: lipocalin family protein [Pirellulaceae bacterium]|nr:lipocalin family protein [Pirellulaceae bacterium]HMO91992.1 lipocalin family protein [Pirellulaceae bacterium]HMP68791.1 lipocalin family protein [Pirellulaceae bacterium]